MKITILKCDKCEAEVKAEDLIQYELRAKFHSAYSAASMMGVLDICRACSAANGYLNVAAPGVKPPDPPPTTQQRLLNVLEEFTNEVFDNREQA